MQQTMILKGARVHFRGQLRSGAWLYSISNLAFAERVRRNGQMFGTLLAVTVAVIAILSFIGLFRAPPPKGDLIGAADRASAALITNVVEDGVRSALRQTSDAELDAMIAEGSRLQAVLREKEKILAHRWCDKERLAGVRVGMRQVRVRVDWAMQECAARSSV